MFLPIYDEHHNLFGGYIARCSLRGKHSSILNYDPHHGQSAQAVASLFRDCRSGGVPYPTMAYIRDAHPVIRRQEGELDVGSTLPRPDDGACDVRWGQVSRNRTRHLPTWRV